MNLLNIIFNTLVFFGGITLIFLIGSYLIYKSKTRKQESKSESSTWFQSVVEPEMPEPSSTKENVIHTVALPDADGRGIFPIAVTEIVPAPLPVYQNLKIPRYQVVNSSFCNLKIWKSDPHSNRRIAFR